MSGFAHLEKGKQAQADSTGNVSGFAWSDTVGWISFNCIDGGPTGNNVCASSNYGVNINPADGLLSDYAWNEHIGWISFNSGQLGGCPTEPCEARMVTTSGVSKLTGWARACTGTLPGDCSSTAPRTDGWDGWISLNNKDNTSFYEPVLTTTSPFQFKGYASGSDVVGPISFNCIDGGPTNNNICPTSNYHVNYNIVLDPPTLTASTPTADGNCGKIDLNWTTSAGATGYHLYRSINSINPADFIQIGGNIPGGTTSYTDQGLTQGATYRYKISAYNAIGESLKSGATAGKMPSDHCNPTNLTAVVASFCSTIDLAWTGVSGITDYDVYQDYSGSGYGAPIVTVHNTTTYRVSSLGNATGVYKFRVAVAGIVDQSKWSNEASVNLTPDKVCTSNDPKIDKFEAIPKLITSHPGQCTLNWTVSNYSANTRCDVTGPGLSLSGINPSAFSPVPGPYSNSNSVSVNSQSEYVMTCYQLVPPGPPGFPATAKTTCNFNPDYIEN